MATDEYGYDLDRVAQYRYAERHHFYWLPCALCGFERGGHEHVGEPSIPIKGRPGVYHGVCRRHPNAEAEYVYVDAHAEPQPQDVRP